MPYQLMPNTVEYFKARIKAFRKAGLTDTAEEEEAKLAELMRLHSQQPTLGIEELLAAEEVLRTHFTIVDWQGIHIIFGAAAALYVSGEMLWLRLVGASRSGKTEILRAIAAHGDTKEVGALTPSAIRGGLKEIHTKLLEQLRGYRVVTFDLAALLTTRRDARNEIFGLLRLVKDGQLVSDFGSHEGHLLQATKFDWLMATTPYFEQVRVMESLLGERFIDLWWLPADREEMAIQAAENNPRLLEIRNTLAERVGQMLNTAKLKGSEIDVSRVDNNWLGKVANIAALLRTPIMKDWKGNITVIPMPEVGTELAQGFQKVALGLQLLGISEYQPYIMRLVRDCVPSVRRALISVLVGTQATADNLASVIPLPINTVRYHLDDLEALEVVTKLGNTNTYRIKAEMAKEMRSIWEQNIIQ
jgi:DNA-binding transcriptional ArsR family regulator